MIFIGLGANLPHPEYGMPAQTLRQALRDLDSAGCEIIRSSGFYESSPVPVSNAPWFVNAAAAIDTRLEPAELLRLMHDLEAKYGRVRTVPNAPRVLDLDVLAYHDLVSAPDEAPILPHPRLSERAFVLLPLSEIAPDWRHPVTGDRLEDLVARLPSGQDCRPIAP